MFDNENGTTGATLAQLGNIGQAIFDPPTLGSSPDVLWETTSAGSFLGANNPAGARVSQTSGPRVSVGWKLTDSPCPTITASAGPNGAISPSGAIRVGCGADLTLNITADDCFTIADVVVDGVSVGKPSSYIFMNVVASHTIAASFSLIGSQANDTDGDGLLDEWETLGIPLGDPGGNRYALPGADPQHKDLFLEMDAMSGHVPDASALTKIVAAFAAAPVCNPDHTTGVRLHLVGNGCDPCMDEADLPEGDWPSVPDGATAAQVFAAVHALKGTYYGTMAERALPDAPARRTAKAKGFRYVVFGKSIGGPSGIAESGGDVTVTHDPLWFQDISADKWAGTLMHELGHSLGLGHGGVDDRRGKPNYYSVMNYVWQWPVSQSAQGFDWKLAYRRSWALDYSRSRLHTLTETSLDELGGIGGDAAKVVPIGPPRLSRLGTGVWYKLVPMGGPVDWNDDGKADDTGVQRDIDFFQFPSKVADLSPDPMAPAEDWSRLTYAPNEPFPTTPPLSSGRPIAGQALPTVAGR